MKAVGTKEREREGKDNEDEWETKWKGRGQCIEVRADKKVEGMCDEMRVEWEEWAWRREEVTEEWLEDEKGEAKRERMVMKGEREG